MANFDSFLNLQNIERSAEEIEYHPLHPFLPNGCKVLFLGSFPPQRKRWAKNFNFFYPNYINDHWRLEGLLFFDDKDYFVDLPNKSFKLQEITNFLEEKCIGFYDTATAVRRLKDNASDKYLEVIETTDIVELLKNIPACKVIVTTGEKATQTICACLGISNIPKVGEYVPIFNKKVTQQDLVLYRLPSSSRAYPLPLGKKADAYKKMFLFAGILNE